GLQDLLEQRLRLGTERALEVGELDDGDRRVLRSAYRRLLEGDVVDLARVRRGLRSGLGPCPSRLLERLLDGVDLGEDLLVAALELVDVRAASGHGGERDAGPHVAPEAHGGPLRRSRTPSAGGEPRAPPPRSTACRRRAGEASGSRACAASGPHPRARAPRSRPRAARAARSPGAGRRPGSARTPRP